MSDNPQVGAQASLFKAGLVLAGIAIAFTRATSRSLSGANEARGEVLRHIQSIDRKLNFLEASLQRVEDKTANLECLMAEKISRTQMDASVQAAVEAAFRPLASEAQRRFALQEDSVKALKTMIGRTDELLGRVLEHLDSPMHSHAA